MPGGKSSSDVQTLVEAGKPNVQKLPWSTGYVGAASDSAPLYRVDRQCFLHGKLHEDGDLVRWDGKPASYMTLVEEGAEAGPEPSRPSEPLDAPEVSEVPASESEVAATGEKESAVTATRKRSRRKR